MLFRGEKKLALRFLIEVNSPFPEIHKTFTELRYTEDGGADEQIAFALLELVSNSIRAHEEKGIREPVVVELRSTDHRLTVLVLDRGGGFDVSLLPYSLDEPVPPMDLLSSRFIEYRERYDNKRFGMGLIAVRRVFPEFSLYFVDEERNRVQWPSPRITGTAIDLKLPLELKLEVAS